MLDITNGGIPNLTQLPIIEQLNSTYYYCSLTFEIIMTLLVYYVWCISIYHKLKKINYVQDIKQDSIVEESQDDNIDHRKSVLLLDGKSDVPSIADKNQAGSSTNDDNQQSQEESVTDENSPPNYNKTVIIIEHKLLYIICFLGVQFVLIGIIRMGFVSIVLIILSLIGFIIYETSQSLKKEIWIEIIIMGLIIGSGCTYFYEHVKI